MALVENDVLPLISVVIPCYNHGAYLQEAIDSINKQAYPSVEIIVIDDGSTDQTKEVTEKYIEVKYIYQKNQGLSAARNTGIANSTGELLVFLDADDWLLPNALKTNVMYLQQNDQVAFVSGSHDKVFIDSGKIKEEIWEVPSDHYCQLLQGNYIGMHATVMYRRWIFDEFLFDTSLKSCEDYDLYLNITRKYPVLHHTKKIAAYRIHTSNMSGNTAFMLRTTLEVLNRQHKSLKTKAEEQAYKRGCAIWKEYYCNEIYNKVKQNKVSVFKDSFLTLIKYNPFLGLKYILNSNHQVLKSIIKRTAPPFALRWMHEIGLLKNHLPAVGQVELGDFNRLTPFSTEFGYDRGGPVDRYYIENFLRKEAEHIRGRVMEIGDNEYTLLFGGKRVTQSDILHVNEGNTKATLIGDISNAPQIPENTFDCIVLTQTLHLVYDFKGALQTCHRILRPGGTLLLTVPGITPIDHGEWKETWYWSFIDKVLYKIIGDTFPNGEFEVNSFGNVFTASAFLYGMGLPEVGKDKLDHQDPHFQLINTVKVLKAPAP